MSDFIEIQWTSGSIDEARKICRFLVEEKLVACAQIIPWIESIYLWNQQLETTQETKVLLKTRKEHYEQIQNVIIKNCKYQVPEILSTSIHQINSSYQDWMEETLQRLS